MINDRRVLVVPFGREKQPFSSCGMGGYSGSPLKSVLARDVIVVTPDASLRMKVEKRADLAVEYQQQSTLWIEKQPVTLVTRYRRG